MKTLARDRIGHRIIPVGFGPHNLSWKSEDGRLEPDHFDILKIGSRTELIYNEVVICIWLELMLYFNGNEQYFRVYKLCCCYKSQLYTENIYYA